MLNQAQNFEVFNVCIFNSAFIQSEESSTTPKMFGLCDPTKICDTKIIDLINITKEKTLDNNN